MRILHISKYYSPYIGGVENICKYIADNSKNHEVSVVLLKKAFEEFQPDLVHFHWANPFPAAVLLTVIPKNVKLLVYWHMDIIKQKYIYRLIKPVETKLLKCADRIVCTSPQYKEGSQPLQPFKDKISIVPNAIDKILSDPDLAHQYAQAAHTRVAENFTIPRMMEKMEEVYAEMQ